MRQIVKSTQLGQWFTSASRDAQELLPHLVRRLSLSTVPMQDLKQLSIAVGDEIGRRGYDGQILSTATHPFVPMGMSVWEMGTGDPERKFADDYKRRTAEPGGIDPATTTFI